MEENYKKFLTMGTRWPKEYDSTDLSKDSGSDLTEILEMLEKLEKSDAQRKKLIAEGWKNLSQKINYILVNRDKYAIKLDESDIVHKKIKKDAKLKFEYVPSEILNDHYKTDDWYSILISGSGITKGHLTYVKGEENAKKIVKAGNSGKVGFFGMELE